MEHPTPAKGFFITDNYLNHDSNANYDQCLSKCVSTAECTVFTWTYGGCYLLDRPLNNYTILPNTLATTAFILSRSPSCADNAGIVTCKSTPNLSSKSVKNSNLTDFNSVKMNNTGGWYTSNCAFSLLKVSNGNIDSVQNGNAAMNTSDCQRMCMYNQFQCTGYIYYPTDYTCFIYDNTVDALGIGKSSMWQCGFLLNRSTNCFDDGSLINCDSSARNLDPLDPNFNSTVSISTSSGSNNTWIIVGVVIGLLVLLLASAVFAYFWYRKKQSQKSSYYIGSTSNLSSTSTPVHLPASPLNNDFNRYSYISQETQYQKNAPSELSDKNRSSLIFQNHSPYFPNTSLPNNFSYSAVLTDPNNGNVPSPIASLVTLQSPNQDNSLNFQESSADAQLPVIALIAKVQRTPSIQPPKLSQIETTNDIRSKVIVPTMEIGDIQPPTISNLIQLPNDLPKSSSPNDSVI
ncbi:hypothetical protein HDV06_005739 [Boothiomyces sp. JEL0866]|nr:hypothetical protein HDV06_005739 [Boothiomyces sp. JEL0866]